MSAGNLLSLARATVNAVPTCLAITVDSNGDANARAINTSKLTDDWTVRFMTDRRTRKVGEIARTGRLTLVYHHQVGGAYVTLVGRANDGGSPWALRGTPITWIIGFLARRTSAVWPSWVWSTQRKDALWSAIMFPSRTCHQACATIALCHK